MTKRAWVTPLAERIAQTAPLIRMRSPEAYHKHVIRPALVGAVNEGRLEVGPHIISQHVRLNHQSKRAQDASDIVSGDKDYTRKKEHATLLTPDGGWLSFTMVLRPRDGEVEVIAYNIERFYGPSHAPGWIRFDFSLPDTQNDRRGLRSHFHPDNEHIQLPSPIFAPHELIDLLLTPPAPRGDRKARTKGEGMELG